jgi:hypothetical protein
MKKVYLTVKMLAEKDPCFSEGSLRWLIHQSKENGFERCLRRIGRRILICEEEFYEYIDNNKCVK